MLHCHYSTYLFESHKLYYSIAIYYKNAAVSKLPWSLLYSNCFKQYVKILWLDLYDVRRYKFSLALYGLAID